MTKIFIICYAHYEDVSFEVGKHFYTDVEKAKIALQEWVLKKYGETILMKKEEDDTCISDNHAEFWIKELTQ